MIQEQVIPIDFGQGVDTKTDPKAVVAGKFLRLENAVFTSPKRIAKRNGYTAVGTTTAPQMVHGYKSELLVADQGNLLSYSASDSAFVSKGKYISTEVARSSIDQAHPASGFTDNAILGNYALYGWSTASQTAPTAGYSQTFGSVVDLQTGTVLVSQKLGTANTAGFLNPVRCVLLGGTTLGILYVNDAATDIVIRIVTFSGGGVVTFGAEQSVTTNFDNTSICFDVVATASGCSILYLDTAGITISNINTSGSVTASASIVDATASNGPFFLSLNGGNLWAYWVDDNGLAGSTLVYAVYSTALAAVLGKTTVKAIPAPRYVNQVVSVTTSATQQSVYYSVWADNSGTITFPIVNYSDVTHVITATSAGVIGTDSVYAYGVIPYSRPVTVSGNNYFMFLYRGHNVAADFSSFLQDPNAPIQPTLFLTQIAATPYVVARFASGVADSQSTRRSLLCFTPNITTSGTKVFYTCGVETQNLASTGIPSFGVLPDVLATSFAYSVDFGSANSYRAQNSGQLAVLNGGAIHAYDGQSVSEFGFHLYPEITNIDTAVIAGGSIAIGTYSYIVIFQWTDAQGNLHQSAPSPAVQVTMVAPNDGVNLVITPMFLSQKTGVTAAIYRTTNGGTVYYLVSDPIFLGTVDQPALTAQFTDIASDSDIQNNFQAYTYPSSAVLENSTPPPSTAMVPHNNRLWFVNDENKNEIWYTKTFSQGNGLSPSAFLVDLIDQKGGDITALAEMDDKLVVGKAGSLFVQSGDGASDTGNSSSLSFPQAVASDVGITVLKSTVTTPRGLMFKSGNGIYILDRALNVSYLGAEVEQYNSQTITSAVLVPGKSQIRFLCSSGLTLVYDYIFNQWSTFTAHTGVSGSTWNNTYVYSSGTAVLQETAGAYTHNGAAFSLLAQTSWLALASIQGFQRVRRLIMLGDFVNGASASHNLSIAAAYDFSTSFQPAVTYAFGAAAASGVFQYRERLPIQKCDSISLLIQETTTGNSSEYVDLTNISFEAGVKKGVNKLGGAYSVG